jgi:hypothetical protein
VIKIKFTFCISKNTLQCIYTEINIPDNEGGTLDIEDYRNAENPMFVNIATGDELTLNAENGTILFEGDLVFDNNDELADFVASTTFKWNTKVEPFLLIPYTFPAGLSVQNKAQIAKTVREFRIKTCVK